MEKSNKTCFNVKQNLFGFLASSGSDGGSNDPQPVASEFTSIGNGTPLLADEIIDGGSSGGGDDASPERRTSRGVVCGNGGNGLAFSEEIIDGGSSGGGDDASPVRRTSRGIVSGNGGKGFAFSDRIIDGGSSGGGDDASPERRTSRGVVAGNGGNCIAFSDGIIDGFGDLLPSGLISDSGDGAIFSGSRNKSISNASGNLLVPDSGTDPFAAPLATLL